ncbi:MAG TPA: methyltransferase domain-containing protein [bacterium]|nr:methyltransferase domain-containing protein [bacterium]
MVGVKNLYKDIFDVITSYLSENEKLGNNYYVSGSKNILTGEINTYVDQNNFTNIEIFFNKLLDRELNILDLGCGLGDKSTILKNVFKNSSVFGLETTKCDDPDQKDNLPSKIFSRFYPTLNKKYNINLGLYDGLNIPFEDSFFDIIVLYAVIEHIAPENRKVFIDTISKKLKKDGYIVITRCPRFWGLMEFISRKFNLGAHPWVLKKKELLGLFDEDKFSVEVFKRMNNVPNNHVVSKYFHKILIPLDKFLDFIKWPFSTDYFLIVKKI